MFIYYLDIIVTLIFNEHCLNYTSQEDIKKVLRLETFESQINILFNLIKQH